jgi:AraC-like DNA-binding protein
VTEAAFSVGYNSISSFSKAFSEYFGMRPMKCRKKKIISV